MTILTNNYLHFTNILFSLIVLFDILVKFKSFTVLKLTFIIITIMNAGINSFNFISNFQIWQHGTIIILKFSIAFSLLFLLCYLYLTKLLKYLNYYLILCLIAYFFQIYFDDKALTLNSQFGLYDIIFVSNTTIPIWFKIIRNIIAFSLFSFNLILLFQLLKKIKEKNIYNLKIKKWITALTFLLAMIFSNYLIQRILNIYNPGLQDFSFALISLFSLLCILFRPQFLNDINFSKIALFNLSTAEAEMNQVIYNEFVLLQYFRKKDASFVNLKKHLDLTDNDLNNFINATTQLDFNDFINKYRVELFLELVKEVQYQNYTIDALAQEVGFSSRHHLYKPFKKFHGGTPSDYINSITN